MEEETSRQIAKLSPTEISEVTKQLGLATAVDSERVLRGIGMVIKKVEELENKVAELQKVPSYPERSEKIGQLITAKSKAKLAAAEYSRSGKGNRGTTYGSLDDMREAFEVALAENELDISFCMQERNGEWVLVSRLAHSSEEWIECVSKLNATKATISDPDQALAASLTSQKRYAYAMLVGINH